MPKFIRLTTYNDKIKEFYVCADKIVCLASTKGYEGTELSFVGGTKKRVMESPESVLNLLNLYTKSEG